jgi:hypothetical protein
MTKEISRRQLLGGAATGLIAVRLAERFSDVHPANGADLLDASATHVPADLTTTTLSPKVKAAQGIRDLSSGLGTALKALGVQDSQLISAAGSVFAAIVDFLSGGIFGALGGLVGALTSLFGSTGPDEITKETQQLATIINNYGKAENVAFLNAWGTEIQDQLGDAQAAEASLKVWTKKPFPDPDNEIETIIAVLAKLAPPSALTDYGAQIGFEPSVGYRWTRPYIYQVFWDDSDSPDVRWPWPPYYIGPPLAPQQVYGYGQQAPTQDSNGDVFYHTYILPSFLYAVSIFLSAGTVLDPPSFPGDYSDPIWNTALFLKSVHDYVIAEGFAQLTPGPFTGDSLNALFATYARDSDVGTLPPYGNLRLSGGQKGILFAFNYQPGPGFIENPGLEIEYGYVEKFSGYSSVGIYAVLTPSSGFLPQKADERRLCRQRDGHCAERVRTADPVAPPGGEAGAYPGAVSQWPFYC